MLDVLSGHPRGGDELEKAEVQTTTPGLIKTWIQMHTMSISQNVGNMAKEAFRKVKTRTEVRTKLRWKTCEQKWGWRWEGG